MSREELESELDEQRADERRPLPPLPDPETVRAQILVELRAKWLDEAPDRAAAEAAWPELEIGLCRWLAGARFPSTGRPRWLHWSLRDELRRRMRVARDRLHP